MIPLPFSVGDAMMMASAVHRWWEKKRRDHFISAWRCVSLSTLYDSVCQYYHSLDVPLFTYPSATGEGKQYPLYVAAQWKELTNDSLELTLRDTISPFSPTKAQLEFWERFREFKRLETGNEWPLHDNRVFRLVEMVERDASLILHFELGKFPDSVMCQYVLESEVRMASLGQSKRTPDLPIRDAVAKTRDLIVRFCMQNVSRIGVNTLILINKGDNEYLPLVYRRSALTMAQERLFDCVSSCIFEEATVASEDLKLRHTVLREIYEELYGNPDVIYRSQSTNSRFFYSKDGVKELVAYLDSGMASFTVTGFCIDLLRIVPEITCLLVVPDPKYHREYGLKFNLGKEFRPSAAFTIPSELQDVDTFLTSIIPRAPDDQPRTHGFDPQLWTLPGAFSFTQGLRRAVDLGLLQGTKGGVA